MGFGGLIITNNGRIELAKAESWEKELKFNYISIGDGKASGSYASRTKLSNELYQLPILKKERIDETLILTADFSNINVEQPFYLREIGIYVNDILYVYDNAGDDAEYIETGGSAVTKEKRIQCALTISSAAKVSVNLKSGLYALQTDMELMQRPEYNNSDVVEELESGESIFTAFGKISKAVSMLISHITELATDNISGHMSAEDKVKIDGVAAEATKSPISNSAEVTETGMYALDAIEKNTSISGTMANKISELDKKLLKNLIGYTEAGQPYIEIIYPISSSYPESIVASDEMLRFIGGYPYDYQVFANSSTVTLKGKTNSNAKNFTAVGMSNAVSAQTSGSVIKIHFNFAGMITIDSETEFFSATYKVAKNESTKNLTITTMETTRSDITFGTGKITTIESKNYSRKIYALTVIGKQGILKMKNRKA